MPSSNENTGDRAVGEVLEALAAELPPILFRNNPRFKELTGLSPRTMANKDSKGDGPVRVKLNCVTGYPRQAVLAWMAARMKLVTKQRSEVPELGAG